MKHWRAGLLFAALGTFAFAQTGAANSAVQWFQRAVLDLTRGGTIGGDLWVTGDAGVTKNVFIGGNSWTAGDAGMAKNAHVAGDLWVQGDAGVSKNLFVGDTTTTTTLNGAASTTLDVNSSVASGTTAYTVDATSDLTSGNHICFRDNATTALLCITFDGIPVTQAGGALSKIRGIVLCDSGGAGTATVGTGCIAQCTNQSSAVAPICTVSGTTLSVTAGADNTVTYHCDY